MITAKQQIKCYRVRMHNEQNLFKKIQNVLMQFVMLSLVKIGLGQGILLNKKNVSLWICRFYWFIWCSMVQRQYCDMFKEVAHPYQ